MATRVSYSNGNIFIKISVGDQYCVLRNEINTDGDYSFIFGMPALVLNVNQTIPALGIISEKPVFIGPKNAFKDGSLIFRIGMADIYWVSSILIRNRDENINSYNRDLVGRY